MSSKFEVVFQSNAIKAIYRLLRRHSYSSYRLKMCVRCLKEGMFVPVLKKKRGRVTAIPSAGNPANERVTPQYTNISTSLPSKVVIETVAPQQPHENRAFLLTPLYVIGMTLSATSLISNLLRSTD